MVIPHLFFGAFCCLSITLACGGAYATNFTCKTLNLIGGLGPGGGYDTYTRLLSRHIGRQVPLKWIRPSGPGRIMPLI